MTTRHEPGMTTYGEEERMRTSGTTGMGTGTAGMGTGTTGAGGVGAGGYGRVVLTIKSAHNLRDKAWLGKADPYVECKLADATISTHHVPNAGESAVFDESFAFNNVAVDDIIEFHVYDKNRLRKDAHMGEGSLSLRQVFESGTMDTRVPLTTRTGTKDAGEVWISVRIDQGAGTMGTGATTGMGTTTAGATTGMGAGATGYGAETYDRAEGYGREGEGYERQGYEREGYEREGYEKTGYEGTGMKTTAYEGGVTGGLEGAEMKSTGTGVTATTAATTTTGEAVCGKEYFTKVEDRPVVKERVTYVQEHRPVEKQFVTEVRPTGVEREAMEGRTTEHLGTEERIVAEAEPRAPCE